MTIKYICVVCGNRVDALFRQYGPTVLKVTNCEICGSISDKYIEYDPVIIMIDMILLSKEAYRHILYNTTFKTYWKLFIVLLLMETYLDWSANNNYKNDSNNIVTCSEDEHTNYLSQNIFLSNSSNETKLNTTNTILAENNLAFDRKDNVILCVPNNTNANKQLPNEDPFLTEKGIYLTFFIISFEMLVYLASVFLLSLYFGPSSRKNKVEFILLLKALTLGGMGKLFMLPTIIWGTELDTPIHAPLVLGYVMLSSLSIHSVIFECSKIRSFLILSLAFILKTSSQPYLRSVTNNIS